MELQRRFTVLHTVLRFNLCSVRLQVPCFKCHSKITWLTAESFVASFCLIDKRLCSDLVFNLVAETCLKLEAREIVFFFIFLVIMQKYFNVGQKLQVTLESRIYFFLKHIVMCLSRVMQCLNVTVFLKSSEWFYELDVLP